MQNKKTFKAAVLQQTAKPLVLMNDITFPTLSKGQVLVKIRYAGLCHSQLMEIQGLRGEDKYLPHMLGHEGVGIVVAIGEGVSKVKPNDEVVISWIKGDGIDAGGTQYKTTQGLTINAGATTAFSEYAVISENRLVLKPKNTPEQIAVLYGCAVPTGFGMVINNIPSDAKGCIAFVGLGGIGMSALLAARFFDFEKVIAIDINEDKLLLAKQSGATHLINAQREDPVKAVNQWTNNRGVDYCFESAGSVKTIEQAYALIRKQGGQCIFASHPPATEKIMIDPFDLICGKNIKGTWGGEVKPDHDVRRFDAWYTQGRLPLEQLISKEYHLNDINEAVEDLHQRRIIRALINCHAE